MYDLGDADVYRIQIVENDSICGCRFSIDEDYSLEVQLDVPVGAGTFEVCVKQSSCGTWTNCTTVTEGASESLTIWVDGACPGIDDFVAFIRVQGVASPGFSCSPYTLTMQTGIGCQ